MRLLSSTGRNLLPLLVFALAACNERGVTGQNHAPAKKATERATPPESEERRRVREMLGTVTIPLVDFEQTSAEEGAEYVRIRVKEIAPEKAVEIEVRRRMPRSEDGKIIRGQVCYGGHTWRAEGISAWQVLERVASDNWMGIEVNQRGVCLIPLPVDGKPVELRPREGEPWPIEEEQEERASEDPPSIEDGAGFLLPGGED